MMLATKKDMIAAFGALEVEELTYWGHSPVGDSEGDAESLEEGLHDSTLHDSPLADALLRASSEAASYLAARYPAFGKAALPEGAAVPPVLVNAVCDITRYRLTGGESSETSPIFIRYKSALAWLRDVASGKASLPQQEEEHDSSSDTLFFSPGSRVWAESSTAGAEDEE